MTSPIHVQLHNPPNQLPKVPGPKHDGLHMAQGLRNCWCTCQRCFLRYASGSGVCICRECPCAGSYEASKPMYVPYRHTENAHG